MRAVIDIGSNSVLLLVGSRAPNGSVLVSRDEARITRLARGASATGRLREDAIERTVAALAEYREIADQLQAPITAVATEGLRVASDPQTFLEPARAALGCGVRMISGEEEARLSYASVAREHVGGALRVVDIGGASTELIVGEGEEIESLASHAIGSVRLTERLVAADPPTRAELAAIDREAREALAKQPMLPHPRLHGLAGTITTAAALLLKLESYDRARVDGTECSLDQIVELRDRLASVPLAERICGPVLPRGRADVIVAGLTILIATLRHCGAQTLVARDRGLRYALI